MSPQLPIVRQIAELRQLVRNWRGQGETVALVPTMGGLHEGHLSLVQLARRHADRVVVSVFVNPTQFAPHEDFAAYPRNEERDREMLGTVPADVMYAPEASEMYPAEFATRVDAAGVAQPLEGTARAHFFSGVAPVVSKLFLQVQPDVAVFGEKDYQQLQVVKQLVRDLNFPIAIVPGPVMREADGLAMSSRNMYLGPQERLVAAQLYAVLKDAGKELEEGGAVEETVQKGIGRLQSHGFRVDYLEVRDAGTLLPVEGHAGRPARLLAAAYLGKVRLIDNIGVSPPAH
jgi:pantoate--beta-alanine ligase